ncbi:hypothetical protein SAMN05216462_1792 [Xylanibacter ruminicola]|uniref:HNH endonuclease n=1 Tax=Xylanibacter ruminicola TaxID=839 RepID=A0A1H4C6H3_XYLRU|nr:hypothetical protein [Xylanibacter ruminicola]SEA55903.1 hypothetical protein SAMN05216462_1792 [Xylanibacter ruminicola]
MTGKIYPEGTEWDKLARDYLAEFGDLTVMERCWSQYKHLHPVLERFNQTVAEIMTSSFAEMVAISQQFRNLPNTSEAEKMELRTIKRYLKRKVFNYDCRAKGCTPHQGVISKFFQKKMEELNVHTCFYCDMAYINPFVDGADTKSQFDLDHAIAKGNCPITALSLHNFVPSCPVCNQRLKHKKPLAANDADLMSVAPCSEQFDADKNIYFKVVQAKAYSGGFMKHQENYAVKVVASGKYDTYAKLFHLEERYEFHKGEALRLLDLKRKYPTSNLKKIANMLHKTTEEVREDIFGLGFSKEHHRCFDKMKRDIL